MQNMEHRIVWKACGWVTFVVILAHVVIPVACVMGGRLEPTCWQERRLVYANFQPRTELRPVCEVTSRWTPIFAQWSKPTGPSN